MLHDLTIIPYLKKLFSPIFVIEIENVDSVFKISLNLNAKFWFYLILILIFTTFCKSTMLLLRANSNLQSYLSKHVTGGDDLTFWPNLG